MKGSDKKCAWTNLCEISIVRLLLLSIFEDPELGQCSEESQDLRNGKLGNEEPVPLCFSFTKRNRGSSLPIRLF